MEKTYKITDEEKGVLRMAILTRIDCIKNLIISFENLGDNFKMIGDYEIELKTLKDLLENLR